MTFLRKEVKSEEMILLARTGLGSTQCQKVKANAEEPSLDTSAALVNTKGERAVFEISETTKIRPVFDATAREGNNPSLNDCLLKGPNLIELIPDILDRFRMYPIGLSADIEKAFLQISVTPEHRDFLSTFAAWGYSKQPYVLEEKEKWEASDHFQGGIEPKRTVICMVLKATVNDRRTSSPLQI
ncbi:putative RNA-directed DNA polymerase from transposon X-element [Trichonephila clavipes]|nr:putative RNA-directed DNA polymerase from transposon X-element [Trichonephila clavipes]